MSELFPSSLPAQRQQMTRGMPTNAWRSSCPRRPSLKSRLGRTARTRQTTSVMTLSACRPTSSRTRSSIASTCCLAPTMRESITHSILKDSKWPVKLQTSSHTLTPSCRPRMAESASKEPRRCTKSTWANAKRSMITSWQTKGRYSPRRWSQGGHPPPIWATISKRSCLTRTTCSRRRWTRSTNSQCSPTPSDEPQCRASNSKTRLDQLSEQKMPLAQAWKCKQEVWWKIR